MSCGQTHWLSWQVWSRIGGLQPINRRHGYDISKKWGHAPARFLAPATVLAIESPQSLSGGSPQGPCDSCDQGLRVGFIWFYLVLWPFLVFSSDSARLEFRPTRRHYMKITCWVHHVAVLLLNGRRICYQFWLDLRAPKRLADEAPCEGGGKETSGESASLLLAIASYRWEVDFVCNRPCGVERDGQTKGVAILTALRAETTRL